MTDNDGVDALDRAIDEVAREVTNADPSPGFVARVGERIRVERRSWYVGWGWQLATGIALLAVIAYVSWPEEERHAARVAATGPTVVGRAAPPAVSAPPVPSTARTRAFAAARRMGTRSRVAPPLTMPRIPIAVDAPQIDALSEVAELTVPVARPRDLDMPGLTVRQVTIAPLEPGDKERR